MKGHNVDPTSKLLDKYKRKQLELRSSDAQLELEIRLKKISRGAFEALYEKLISLGCKTGEVETTINAVSRDFSDPSSTCVRRLTFRHGMPAGEDFYQKQQIGWHINAKDYIDYAISLSVEKPVSRCETSLGAQYRAKVRVSFICAEYRGWRVDMTFVSSGDLDTGGPQLAELRRRFMREYSAATILSEIDHSLVTSYEVELEYIGERAPTRDDFGVARHLFSLLDSGFTAVAEYQAEVYEIAKLIHSQPKRASMFRSAYGLKKLVSKAASITKDQYIHDIYPPDGYYLTDKADGIRALARYTVADSTGRLVIIADKLYKYSAGAVIDGGIVVDSEMLTGGHTSQQQADSGQDITLLVFDVIMYGGVNISDQPFSTRQAYIGKAVEALSTALATVTDAPGRITMRAKEYIVLQSRNLEVSFKAVIDREYATDGLIMTPPDKDYAHTVSYKWKPESHNTIDFLARECPKKMLGVDPYKVRPGYKLYWLFVGIRHNVRERLNINFVEHYTDLFPVPGGVEYFPIQFSPSNNPMAFLYYHKETDPPIDGKIVELLRKDGGWEFIRSREDRSLEKMYYGNDYPVAEQTYLNYIDPFRFEDLWLPVGGYFAKDADDIYSAPNKYKRYVISMMFKNYLSGAKWVFDLAAGRGADLHRYSAVGVSNVVFMDIDATAISELTRRRLKATTMRRQGDQQYKPVSVYTEVADLKLPAPELIERVKKFGTYPGMADAVVCNFALHYMCDTVEHLQNLLSFAASMLKIGGIFMFSIMDGDAVNDLLRGMKPGESWVARQGTTVKYEIVKKYTGDKLSFGQIISVRLPFAAETVDEPLVNIDQVLKVASKQGFALELNESFAKYMAQFKDANKVLYAQLNDIDIQYINLHRVITIRKVKETKPGVVGGRRRATVRGIRRGK